MWSGKNVPRISTTGGPGATWIGDTIQFTQPESHKIKITGGWKHYINAFGEAKIADNSDKATVLAAVKTNAVVTDHNGRPVYFQRTQQRRP